ncbi:MAG: hypothetical protein NWE89_16650 [Candidatus Bathyarchaeota archaeon]|nr:hypothetical protein [Candidatus Bathyarchaeota archaeon]
MSEGSLKEIALLLRKGATMLSEICPDCDTPLFKLRNGDIICPMCNKQVKFVKADTDTEAMARQGSLEATLNKKIADVQAMLEKETDPAKMLEITGTLTSLLEALEKVKKLS